MATALSGLSYLAGLVCLVCFIMVLIAMFSNQQTILAIVCIVLSFLFGLGSLIAFIYGWMKASEWSIQRIMYIWTAAAIVGAICWVAGKAVGFGYPGI